MSNPDALIYLDTTGTPRRVGSLWVAARHSRESAVLEFDPAWLADPIQFALGPALAPGPGRFVTPVGHGLFGAIGDSAPDRWGRGLLLHRERQRAKDAGEMPRALRELDYLLGVNDATRMGALRFQAIDGGPFLGEPGPAPVPPLLDLPHLMRAAMALEEDSGHAEVIEALRLLLAPGSSLGGARPKASVRDQTGRLSLAKFPKATDTRDVTRWEVLMLRLAHRAGIPVPEHHILTIDSRNVLVMARFDRQGDYRVPFLSAMSLISARDGDVRSYVEIAEELRRIEGPGRRGGPSLWRRVVFNILASNFDDHLRNHAILFDGAYWALSPAYDLNPVPAPEQVRRLSTAIHIDGNQAASLDVALDATADFDLDAREARMIIGEVARAVAGWRHEATNLGIKSGEIDEVASAFEHPEADAARHLSAVGR